ncbi:MAG TPA: hypothetical protein VMX11_09885 [Actinomycetes bacterium]|nr:hypothetical protein [Actinomycetes bacterium]
MNFTWKQYVGTISKTTYHHDGSECWTFADDEPVTVLTVCLGTPPPDGCIYVKSYSENEGVLEALVAQGYVEDTGLTVSSGWIDVNVAKVVELNKGT